MFKKLQNLKNNKKGFTLVELIVVIVIILILAAVMVPSVTRYVGQSRKANCKADAAALLTDIQAKVADAATTNDKTFGGLNNVQLNGVTITVVTTTATVPKTEKTATAEITADYDVKSIAYFDGTYNATWSADTGWDGSAFDS